MFILTAISEELPQKGIEQLYEKYQKLIYRMAYNILNDHYLAQDIVHTTFIKIISNIDRIKKLENNEIRAFIMMISRNLCFNILKEKKKDYLYDNLGDMENLDIDVDEQIINNELLEEIKQKIKLLYPPYADIIAMKYYFEYSDTEISRILDITEQNVRVRLHRARSSLLKLIRKEKEDDKSER